MPKYNIIRLTFSLLQFTIPKIQKKTGAKVVCNSIVGWNWGRIQDQSFYELRKR